MPHGQKRISYDTSALIPQLQYVCWLDLMGAQSIMRRSLRQATAAVMKIHVAFQEELGASTDVIIHPVIDGVYMRSLCRPPLEDALRKVMGRLAETFISETANIHRCLYRGGIAFGPLVAGTELSPGAQVFDANSYTNAIAIGMPLAQAYSEERVAPLLESRFTSQPAPSLRQERSRSLACGGPGGKRRTPFSAGFGKP